jgi:hypothetical protein
MQGDLRKLAAAVRLSRAERIIKQNMFVSILFKGSFVLLAPFGLATPWLAAIGFTGGLCWRSSPSGWRPGQRPPQWSFGYKRAESLTVPTLVAVGGAPRPQKGHKAHLPQLFAGSGFGPP